MCRLSAICDTLPDDSDSLTLPRPDGSIDIDPEVSVSTALWHMIEQIVIATMRGVTQQLLKHFFY